MGITEQQDVKIGDETSPPLEVNCRVPQGTVLLPVLFNLYVNNLFLQVNGVSIFAYAVDTDIYIEGIRPGKY